MKYIKQNGNKIVNTTTYPTNKKSKYKILELITFQQNG